MVLRRWLVGCVLSLFLPVPVSASAAQSPADSTLDRLRDLRLARVRVTAGPRPVVLHDPRFDREGVRWTEADGFPRRRPALIAGADWDSIRPPSNPVAWERIARVEQPTPAPFGLAGFLGGVGGFVVGYGAVQTAASESDWTSGQVTALSIGSGVVGALLGGWLAHAFFGPRPGWQTVYAAPAVP